MKIFSAFLMILLFWSCNDKVTYEKPEDLIGKEKMTDLLYEMHIAIGTSNLRNIHLEKNRNYLSLVYEKYGVDSTQFATSNLYYTSNIIEYEEIYEEVERRLDTLKNYHQAIMDSINGYQTNQRKEAIEKNKDSLNQVFKNRN
ncbi:DUF4296 domain-containing protein [Lutimonas sp.]|uniref:DUF4296 domain-containing protein n=1 Tax=Lutimonas sp. TaxID=1872403 RepID=UPI003D9BF0A9